MRSWLVIPAMGAASAAAAFALGVGGAVTLLPVALAGAAITAAIRALAGDSPAALIGAGIAPLLMIASWFDPGLGHGIVLFRAAIAIAGAAWTVVELARPSTSPLVAMLPATIAAVLEPSFVGLVAIAGARLVTAPWQRPRWVLVVPLVGGLAVVLAVLAGAAHGGALGHLGDRWYGGPAHAVSVGSLARLAGDAVGPLTALAALAGLAALARRRHAEVAIAACVVGTLLVDLRAGAIGPSMIAVTALCAGLGVGRFAGQLRLLSGQALLATTAGVLLVVPPAWTAIERSPRVAIGHASR